MLGDQPRSTYDGASQAVGCRQGRPWAPSSTGGLADRCRAARTATGAQASVPTSARMLQEASEACQLPSHSCSGTASADDAAAPPIIANMYSPVTRPARSGGNSALTSRG